MADIGLFLKDNTIDIEIEKEDIQREEGLRTSVLISLFTDRRVEEEELPLGHTHKRGWWGDMFSEIDKDEIGSKLWLLERGKQTLETESDAEEYVKESLQWMIEDGVASNISVEAEFIDRGVLAIRMEIEKPQGESQRFSLLWDLEENRIGEEIN
ncbi:MAG: phage GP46 family protein [Deltaproteobacteria bacterium]|nr:phage GP46 family protein [Deltaproteobacteria bacterium]